MGKFWRASIVGLGLAFAFSVFTPCEASAQGILREILSRMDSHNKALASLKSDIKLIRYNAQLNEADVNEGSVTFLPETSTRPVYARIDWVRPRLENIVLIGDSFQLYVPALRLLTRGSGSVISSGMLGLLTMSKAQLKENHRGIDYLGQEQIADGVETWHLRLYPRKKGYYKWFDVWVDGDGMPRQVTSTGPSYHIRPEPLERFGITAGIVEMLRQVEETYGIRVNCEVIPVPVDEILPDGDTLILNRIRKNEIVDPDIFTIKPPKGTTLVKG